MTQDNKAQVDRRDLLRGLGISASAAVTPAVLDTQAKADSESNDEKRKARYNPNSADVKAFYRVNNYPK
jgi:hypothetical protein